MRDRRPPNSISPWPAHPATVFWTHPQLVHPPTRQRRRRVGFGQRSYWSVVGILLTIALLQSVAPTQETVAIRSDDPGRIAIPRPGTAN